MNQQYRNIVYLSDRGGTGFWRHTQQMMAINCIAQQLNLQLDCTQTPVLDQNFYKGMTSVTVQRWISDQQEQIFNRFLKPLCDANSGFLVYAIDDAMHYEEIPLYNRGRGAFASDKIQSNIKSMLNNADFVIVTTEHIKQYYHDKYGVPLENILAVPNLLPRWWFGDKYDLQRKIEQFKRYKAKPRIGIVSSLSHFNVDNVRVTKDGKAAKEEKLPDGTSKWFDQDHNEVKVEDTEKITDDFDEIAQCIRDTVDDFQYVCFGYCPPQIQDLANKKKIEVHGGTAILNYPEKLSSLQLQAIIAPIKKMEFNFCKSHIKYMECAAIGVPLFATRCLPYDRVMPDAQLFDSSDELKQKLMKLKFTSTGAYQKMVEAQWNWFNSQHDEGDFHLNTYWMEPNLQIWIDIYRLRQKTLSISMSNFAQQYEARMQKAKENTIFQNDNILIIK